MTRRQVVGTMALLGVALALAFLRWMIDRDPVEGLGFAWPDEAYAVFRRTSILVAAAIGAALAVSGVLLQALLRNPLASPFILGLSSGAGLGVMLAMYIGYAVGIESMRLGTNAGPALIGAMSVLTLVYLLGRRGGLLDPLSLVLVGVIASAMCGALIMFLQRLVPGGLRGELAVWMMGRIPQNLTNLHLIFLCGLALFGMVVATMLGRAMDAATLGDDEARSIGLAAGRRDGRHGRADCVRGFDRAPCSAADRRPATRTARAGGGPRRRRAHHRRRCRQSGAGLRRGAHACRRLHRAHRRAGVYLAAQERKRTGVRDEPAARMHKASGVSPARRITRCAVPARA